ncbi:hypothetical protein JCM3766R1_002425 [Sporobolomyces carnicolor]
MTTELLVTGILPADLHSVLVSTLARLCERGESFSQTESVFRRTGATANDVRIRVRAIRLRSEEQRTHWSLTVLHRPEPVRISPHALQYSVSEISVDEGVHPRELVSSFGFDEKEFEVRKRGTVWERSGVEIQVFRLFPDDSTDEPHDRASFVVEASVRFSQPASSSTSTTHGSGSTSTASRSSMIHHRGSTPNAAQSQTSLHSAGATGGGGGNSGQEERDKALDALEGVKRALKGVVDLKRVE